MYVNMNINRYVYMLQRGLVQRSALGLVAVYNLLPERLRAEDSVKGFQTSLQKIVKNAAGDGIPEWRQLLSPRHSLKMHPLEVNGEIWTSLACL